MRNALGSLGTAVMLVGAPAVPDHPVRQAENCRTDFDRLVRKVEENYAGYRLEITPATRRSYEQHRDRLRAQAANAPGDWCYYLLRDFLAYFRDPHLFIFQSTRLDTAETTRRSRVRSLAPTGVPLNEEQARAYFIRRMGVLDSLGRFGALDPIEGIWFEPGLRVAIVRDSDTVPSFRAIVLTSDTSTWAIGTIRARFTRRSDGSYDAMVMSRNHARRELEARVHKRVLLRLSPGIWGKEFPALLPDDGLLDPHDPHRPTVTRRGDAMVVSVPSHDAAFRPRLDSLVAQHAAALAATPILIIDLRGNEGGASFMTNALLPFIASDSQRPSVLAYSSAVMLSSEDQIRYVQRSMVSGSDTTPSVQRLLARLRANPGQLVPLEDSLDRPEPRRDSVIAGPRRVGILIDGGTVSAAEAFLARAMRSTRVTVFGGPTAGALDYQSVSIVPFQETDRRWFLGYPTIAASKDLPAGGIKGKGLQPHVRMDWSREPDPILAVMQRLQATTRELQGANAEWRGLVMAP